MTSDQVREPATVLAMVESAVDSESTEEGSAYCTMAEGELNSDNCTLPALLPSSACPEFSVSPVSAMKAICELSVRPELSTYPETTTEIVSLSLALPVLGVALWCVWAAHTVSKPPDHPELLPSLPLPPPLHQSSPS